MLVLFLANHQGIVSPVTWLIMAEMFPTSVKARFMSIAYSKPHGSLIFQLA
ncbi:MFS transporter (plasmid) [Lactiplantibacillus plantarum]|nr:MFS transporter [Lactiplantibacillus plantarum]WCE45045.1 MFS transporter [Lactiplantibacillus plantarum]